MPVGHLSERADEHQLEKTNDAGTQQTSLRDRRQFTAVEVAWGDGMPALRKHGGLSPGHSTHHLGVTER